MGSEWLPFEFDGPSPQVSEKPGELQTAPAGEEDFASILDRMRPPTAKDDVPAGEVWREAIRGFSGDTLQTGTIRDDDGRAGRCVSKRVGPRIAVTGRDSGVGPWPSGGEGPHACGLLPASRTGCKAGSPGCPWAPRVGEFARFRH